METSDKCGRDRSGSPKLGRWSVLGRKAALVAAAFALAVPVRPIAAMAKRTAKAEEIVDRMTVVDCLLPGRVRQLGRHARWIERRRPARLSAGECEARGGEYVAVDRADTGASFDVWMPLAMDGDAKAQLIVGELAERGRGGAPDYALAKLWYERAAEQGDVAAMFNLGRIHEEGLGVAADKAKASDWYRKAYGLDTAEIGDAVRFAELQSEIRSLEATVGELEAQLADALQDRDRLEAELRDREAALDDAQNAVAAVTGELAAARAENAAALDAYKQALSEVGAVETDIARERAALAAKEAALAEKAQKLRAAQAEADEAFAREVETVTALDDQAAALDALRAELSAERARVRRLEDEKARALAANARTAEDLASARSALDEKLADVAAREKALADREAGLADALARTEEASVEDAAALKVREVEIAREKADLAARRASLAKELAAFNVARAEQAALADDLAGVEARLDAERRALAEREERLDETEAALAERARRLSADDQRKSKALRKLDREKRALAEDRAELRAERDSLASERSEVDSKAKSLRRAEADLAAKTAAVEQRAQILAERERSVNERETKLAGLEAEAAEAKAKLSELEAIIAGNRRSLRTSSRDPNAIDVDSKSMRIEFGEYHAILIGNANYADPNWVDLETPHNDVKRIGQILRERYGFKTKILLDANRADLLLAIEEMRSVLGKEDNLLIYYAGHGRYSDDARTGYWEPVDSIAENFVNSVPSHTINDYLSTLRVRKVLVVADSCYSGAFARAMVERLNPDAVAEKREKFLMMQAAKKSRVVMTAGGLKPVADSVGNGHSLFASAFINALADTDDVTLARNLFSRIRQVVVANALAVNLDQEPVFADMVLSGHEGGDFIFVPDFG